MNNDNKNWNKEFAAFERDLDMTSSPYSSVEELDFSYPEVDFDQPDPTAPEPKPEHQKPEPKLQEPVVEELPVEIPQPIVVEEKPQRLYLPLTANDMTKLQSKLAKGIDAASLLHDQAQRIMSGHDDIRLPKGLRTTVKLLADITNVLIATKVIIDLFLELDVEPLYQSVDDCGLKTTTNNTVSTLMTHVPTMEEGFHDVEKAMTEGGYDRPSANLRMRIVKAQAQSTQSLALQQAQALAKVIETFPLENGALRLLCLIKEKGDKVAMGSIDRTMELAEQVEVYVEYAPAMLEAVKKNDQKAVDAIVRKMLDNS